MDDKQRDYWLNVWPNQTLDFLGYVSEAEIVLEDGDTVRQAVGEACEVFGHDLTLYLQVKKGEL